MLLDSQAFVFSKNRAVLTDPEILSAGSNSNTYGDWLFSCGNVSEVGIAPFKEKHVNVCTKLKLKAL